jgi:hypothetical protein
MKNLMMALVCAGLLVTCVQTTHAGSVAGAAKKGAAVGYARIDVSGAVVAFGGKGTTNVASIADGFGTQTVTFTGKYPDDLTADKVIVTTTAQALNYGVSNAFVNIADATTIVVFVYDWTSTDTNQTGSSINVVLHIGQ